MKVIVSSASTTVTTITTTNTTPTSKTTIQATTPVTTNTQSTETGDRHNKKEGERWTQVTRGKKKSPSKTPISPEKQSPAQTGENKSTEERKKVENPNTQTEMKIEVSNTKTEKRKKKEKTNVPEVSHEEIDSSTNLKRSRDSGDYITEGEGEKKQCKNKNLPPKAIPQPQQKQPRQRPTQIVPIPPPHATPSHSSENLQIPSTQCYPPSHLSHPPNCSPGLFLRQDTIKPQKSSKHRKEPSRSRRKTDKHRTQFIFALIFLINRTSIIK